MTIWYRTHYSTFMIPLYVYTYAYLFYPTLGVPF